ncbi:MAG: hypothetical protein Q8940_02260 [Bacteroidota bacterium]|nr:hypothetical protein [Bacteroidota bacterium]
MSVLTDFFVASDSEVNSIFQKDNSLVATQQTISENNVIKKVISKIFNSRKKSIEAKQDQFIFDISKFPYKSFKNVLVIELSDLYKIITGESSDKIYNEFSKFAVEPLPNDEIGLHKFPPDFVRALSILNQIDEIATKWSKTEEFELDNVQPYELQEIIEALRELSQVAVAKNKNLYLYWSL